MLERINRNNCVCSLIRTRVEVADLIHSLLPCFLSRSFEYRLSDIEANYSESIAFRQGNRIVPLSATKIDNHLSAKLVQDLVAEQDPDFDFVLVDVAGHASRFPRRDPLEEPVLHVVQERVSRLRCTVRTAWWQRAAR